MQQSDLNIAHKIDPTPNTSHQYMPLSLTGTNLLHPFSLSSSCHFKKNFHLVWGKAVVYFYYVNVSHSHVTVLQALTGSTLTHGVAAESQEAPPH